MIVDQEIASRANGENQIRVAIAVDILKPDGHRRKIGSCSFEEPRQDLEAAGWL